MLDLKKILQALLTTPVHSFNSRSKYKRVRSDSDLLASVLLDAEASVDSISIDLGCGARKRNPFNASSVTGIDVQTTSQDDIQLDLSLSPLPFSDSTIDFASAYDFLEHVPRFAIINNRSVSPLINLLNEVYRVLKPGALFYYQFPAYPAMQAFSDPTHVNYFTEDSVPDYFCSSLRNQPNDRTSRNTSCFASIYGFKGDFTLLGQAWIGHTHVAGVIRINK